MRKNIKEVLINKERYDQLVNIESNYKILSQLLIYTSYLDEKIQNISFKEERILKVLEVANEELYKKIINKFKEEKE